MKVPEKIGYYIVEVFNGERSKPYNARGYWDGSNWSIEGIQEPHWNPNILVLSFKDKRYELMRERFLTLSKSQLQMMKDNIHITLFDEYNFNEGKFCPMGIALGAHNLLEPSDKGVKELIGKFYQPTNTLKGVEGEFYHGTPEGRKQDLLNLINELLY